MGPRRLVEYMCGAFDFVVFKVLLVPFSALASKRPATEAWEFRGGILWGSVALVLFKVILGSRVHRRGIKEHQCKFTSVTAVVK